MNTQPNKSFVQRCVDLLCDPDVSRYSGPVQIRTMGRARLADPPRAARKTTKRKSLSDVTYVAAKPAA